MVKNYAVSKSFPVNQEKKNYKEKEGQSKWGKTFTNLEAETYHAVSYATVPNTPYKFETTSKHEIND